MKKYRGLELNQRPIAYEAIALTPELPRLELRIYILMSKSTRARFSSEIQKG